MRIAIANWTARRVGGVEAYLRRLVPVLLNAGHQVALVAEMDAPDDREPIVERAQTPLWTADRLGLRETVDALRQWRPDVVYTHGSLDPGFDELIAVAPAMQFLHTYYGTCISGAKTFTIPAVRPCEHPFGPACLLRYYPRRTGGLSPVTMVREYRRQRRRLDLLRRRRLLLTHSNHMRDEYLRQGFPANDVRTVRWFVPAVRAESDAAQATKQEGLLFVGRMDPLKGGTVLLDALAALPARPEPLHVTFVGDGPDRAAWEQRAKTVTARHPGMQVTFTGWLAEQKLSERYAAARLLIMPSLWPEPFGQVGLEAALFGVPTVAFDVGGIGEWLQDGVTGRLVTERCDPQALARAIDGVLADAKTHDAMSRAARAHAATFTAANHLTDLEQAMHDTVNAAAQNG